MQDLAIHMDVLSDCDKIFTVYNMGLAEWFICKYFNKSDCSFREDLFQAAYFGIMSAKQRWNSKKGTFSTYAFYHMKAFVIKEYEHNTQIIDIYGEAKKRIEKRKLIRKLKHSNFNDYLKYKRLVVKETEDMYRKALFKVDRLDGKRFLKHDRDGNKVSSYHDVLKDENAVNAEEYIIKKETEIKAISLFNKICDNWTKKYATLYKKDRNMRKALWNIFVDGHTLEQVGDDVLFVTRARVGQIKNDFLREYRRIYKQQATI